MKRVFAGTSRLVMFSIFFGLILLFSCSDEEDMRQKTVKELGEPDEIVTGGYGVDEYEIYYYDNINIDRAYMYQKSASGCGGSGNWYIANTWMASWDSSREIYEPPTIIHSPVKTAALGTAILIQAEVTDDNYVKDVILYYCALPDTNFLAATMSFKDSTTYFSEIPADMVTASGVEYYLEAHDSAHTSRLPEIRGTYLISVSADAQRVVGKPETSDSPNIPNFPVSREKSIITQ